MLPPRAVCVAGLFLVVASSSAAVFKAGPDGTYATIQSALDAARVGTGDHEVRVERGTYLERLTISDLGAASRIVVTGGWDAAFATRSTDAAATVVDASAEGRVVSITLSGGELVLDGLTLTNGRLTTDLGAAVSLTAWGSSVVRFRHDRVVGNATHKTINPGGYAGIYAEVRETAAIFLDGCVVADNVATGGPGVSVEAVGINVLASGASRVEVTSSTISDNRATSAGPDVGSVGLGIWASGSAALVFTDNTVTGNLADVSAGAWANATGCVLGIEDDASIEALRNVVTGNGSETAAGGNQASLHVGWGHTGSGVASEWLVTDAVGPGIGGAVLDPSSSVVIANWTIANNPGPGIRAAYKGLGLVNSIVTGNGTELALPDHPLGETVLVGSDALFVAPATGDYRLRAGSPAIDAGRDAGAAESATDLGGAPRRVGAAVDLGAYEFQGSAPKRLAAVAHSTGYGGTAWRTSLGAVNTTSSPVDLALTYVTGAAPLTRSVRLPAGGADAWDDVLVEVFGFTEGSSTSGSLAVTGPGVAMAARTYADGGVTGTYGQYYPALLPAGAVTAGAAAVIPLLRSDDDFYTNVGMITTSASSCTATVTVHSLSGATLGSPFELAAGVGRWVQRSDALADLGDVPAAYATVAVADSCAAWLYASVIDRITRDPTTVPVLVASPAATLQRVPSAAHTTGFGGTPWRTSLVVVNPSAEYGSVSLVDRDASAELSESELLAPGEARTWDDVLVELFGVDAADRRAGVIEVSGASSLVVASRTYADGGAAGTYGQYYPAVTAEDGVAAGETGVIPQVRSDESYYTNVGVLNTGTTPVTVRITLHDATGTALGSPVTRNVAAGAWTQVNDVFLTAGAGTASTAYADVRVTSATGSAFVNASVIDRTTRDPTTIPAIRIGSI